MANQYMNHAGPGPSSSPYYDQSGVSYDPNYNHAGPSSYPYQYGPPRPVNGHVHQNYYPQQHQHHFSPNGNGIPPMNGKQPHPHPYTYHHPYPSNPPSMPASPSAWHHHQSLPQSHSPLPKQLAAQNFGSTTDRYVPEAEPAPKTVTEPEPSSSSTLSSSSHAQSSSIAAPPLPSSSESKSNFAPAPVSPTASSHSHSHSRSQSNQSTTALTHKNISPTWAVWSRRPTDPNLAPGLVFSSRTHPPENIVRDAMDVRTPPASPVAKTASLPDSEVAAVAETKSDADEPETDAAKATDHANSSQGSQDSISVSAAPAPSSASTTATTATPTPSTTLPGSPASSTTSISPSVAAAPLSKDVPIESTTSASADTSVPTQIPISTAAEAAVSTTTLASAPDTTTTTAAPVANSTPTSPTVPAPPPLKKSWASLLKPSTAPQGSSSSTSASGSASGAQRRTRLPTSSVVGFSVPADTPSFSGSGDGAGAGARIPQAKCAELLALLNSDFDGHSSSSSLPSSSSSAVVSTGKSYAALASVPKVDDASSKAKAKDKDRDGVLKDTTPAKIHPRGLINTGNMCFANSVLQLLIYSPPFFRLFHELRRIGYEEVKEAGGSGVGSANASIETPLVDATTDFLMDFLPGEKEKERRVVDEKEKERKGVSGASAGPNGASGSGSTSGSASASAKGKERSSTPHPEASDEDAFCPFIPTGIYDALKTKKQFESMRWGQQEDAEEFLGFYLEGLEEELGALLGRLMLATSSSGGGGAEGGRGKRRMQAKEKEDLAVEETEEDAPPEAEQDGWLEVGKKNRTVVTRTIKSTDSPITRIFGGKFRSSLRVPGQKESAIVEEWRSLRLDIQRDTIQTIQDALSHISQPQTVHLTDPPREGSQQVLIEALPPVLVLHMKRFEYDAAVGGVVKVGKQITFGPELVVGADVLSSKARTGLGSRGARYKLFGAIYHHGISASGGHYTLDVLHPDRFPRAATAKPIEGWVRIDDELVSDVRPEDVFGEIDDSGVRCPYLLFYRRIR